MGRRGGVPLTTDALCLQLEAARSYYVNSSGPTGQLRTCPGTPAALPAARSRTPASAPPATMMAGGGGQLRAALLAQADSGGGGGGGGSAVEPGFGARTNLSFRLGNSNGDVADGDDNTDGSYTPVMGRGGAAGMGRQRDAGSPPGAAAGGAAVAAAVFGSAAAPLPATAAVEVPTVAARAVHEGIQPSSSDAAAGSFSAASSFSNAGPRGGSFESDLGSLGYGSSPYGSPLASYMSRGLQQQQQQQQRFDFGGGASPAAALASPQPPASTLPPAVQIPPGFEYAGDSPQESASWTPPSAFTITSRVYPYRTLTLFWRDPFLPDLLRPIIRVGGRVGRWVGGWVLCACNV